MASGKTTNYGLSQWEATDKVERLDFNGDNEKLDAAIKAAQDAADSAQEATDNLAAAAYTPENSPFVVGTYKGNGTASRTISLGFTPQAVFVAPTMAQFYNYASGHYVYGGMAVTGSNVCRNTSASTSEGGRIGWASGQTAIMIVDGGFKVSTGNSGYAYPRTNDAESYYNYIAFR